MNKAIPWMVAAVVVALVAAHSMYNKPHRDYASEKVLKSWSSADLLEWHTSHPESDHAQWQDQVVQVKGKVASVTGRGVVMAPGVVVTWEQGENPPTAFEGTLTIQGRLVGFDDVFSEVRIDHARIVD